jgi:non-specific serine/threonine protein kinase
LLNRETRLLTLTGVGGSGKTRLALQLALDLAAEYSQRVWLVELAAVNNDDLVPIVVGSALGLHEIGSTAPLATLTAFLAPQPALLCLDNCEHLIEASAAIVDALLRSCPYLRVITTSREPLRIAGERQYRVPPLDTPDLEKLGEVDSIAASPAVQLFIARAQAALPPFQLTPENAATVARICSRLAGIPLALELAATRVRTLGVEQILTRLDDTFRLLTGGSRIAPTRHQTLRAALEWSDALLTDAERTVFRRLAVFAGDFQLETAEALCSDSDIVADSVLDILTGLVNKSLVTAESDDHAAWYQLLEPVRQFALGALVTQTEVADIRARHAAFYLERAERAAIEMLGPEQERWLATLEREQSNLRAALEWAEQQNEAEFALRLAVALAPFWEIRGHLNEGLRWLRVLLARTSTNGPSVLRARALAGAGRLVFALDHTLTSRYTEAEELTAESLRMARDVDDERTIAAVLTDLGVIHRLQNDYARSITCLEDALARHQELGDEHGTMTTLLHLGCSRYMQGDRVDGTRLVIESLERAQALGDVRFTATAQSLLGRAAMHQKAFAKAIELIDEALKVHLRLGDRWFVTFDLTAFAEVFVAAGYAQQGVRMMGAAQASSDRLGSPVGGVSFVDIHQWIDDLQQEEWFEQVWAEGYALEPPDAMQLARTTLAQPTMHVLAAEADKPAFAPLTRREVEVARLLAAGYTDRQIADTLYLALRTVGAHVHNILRKLGLRSRLEVAAWLKAHESSASPSSR